jgi:transposase
MLTQEDDVEIHALARRGWSKSAIARHTGRDRKTVAKYLAGNGPRRELVPSCLEPYRAYIEARFVDDPHVRASVLFGELVPLGFDRSYPTLVREIRELGLRPVCGCCKAGGVTVTVGLDHEPGEELQLDWLELVETPWGEKAYVLVGALSHSGRVRGVFADGMTFAHLIEALDGVLRRLGGTTKSWRTDRMATFVYPGRDRLRPEAAAAAKHYGVTVAVCPANRPQRKGVVEKAIDYVTQSWWRSAPVSTPAEAQADLDRWSVAVSDRRRRGQSTVGELAASEPLLGLPELAFPAEHQAERVVADDALVAFESNRYSVPPGYAAQTVTVRARLGEVHLEIYSQAGRRIARHRRAPNGAGQVLRSPEHARLLEQAVLAGFTTAKRCPRKPNRPPGERALAEAARLRGQDPGGVVVDLEQYARIARIAGGHR